MAVTLTTRFWGVLVLGSVWGWSCTASATSTATADTTTTTTASTTDCIATTIRTWWSGNRWDGLEE